MIYTMFHYPAHATYADDVDDANLAMYARQFPQVGAISHILWQTASEVLLPNIGSTFNLAMSTWALSDWVYLFMQVVGQINIITTGKDADGATSISATLPLYGTTAYPDIGVFSTYNLSAIELSAVTAGSSARYFFGISCDDSDSRLSTYA